MAVPPVTIATLTDLFPNFDAKKTSCIIFCEAEQQLLVLDGNIPQWNLPGDDFVENSSRKPIDAALQIFKKQTNIDLEKTKIQQIGDVQYARLEKVDRILYFFRIN